MTIFPVLRTERLELDLPGAAEAAESLAYVRDNAEHLAPWSPPPPDGWLTEGVQAERLELARQVYRAGAGARFCVHPRGERRVIGGVSLSNVVRGSFSAAHLGYGIDARWQGRGIGAEAVAAVVAYAFDTLGLHRVMANHRPENTRSAALLRRLGFVVEGYARDYLFIDGAWRDHVLTARTNPAMGLTDPPRGGPKAPVGPSRAT